MQSAVDKSFTASIALLGLLGQDADTVVTVVFGVTNVVLGILAIGIAWLQLRRMP